MLLQDSIDLLINSIDSLRGNLSFREEEEILNINVVNVQ